MRIVLASALYPPDIAEPAPYVKELAARLSKSHQVTVVAYAHLPEEVAGVRMVAVDKRRPLPARLFAYYRALRRAAKDAAVVYAENGASVELPALLIAGIAPVVMHLGDSTAHERAAQSLALRLIERAAFARAKEVIALRPLPRPEAMPLDPPPVAEQAAYEESWRQHLAQLERIFSHAGH